MSSGNSIVVLCGGDINYSNLPIGTNASNAMIPVNGKPVLGWLMEDIIDNGYDFVSIVTRKGNTKLIDFINWAFTGRIPLEICYTAEGGSILHSLESGLKSISSESKVTVLLGDTLIKEKLNGTCDFLFVSGYDNPKNWCLAEFDENNTILRYYDKVNVNKEGLKAVCGLYAFEKAGLLRNCTAKAISEGKKELSQVLDLYGKVRPLKAIYTDRWYDFGHMPHFSKAKKELLQSRYFNSLVINEAFGYVDKISEKSEKLLDEYYWYTQLPPEISVLSPRILGKEDLPENKLRIRQEYYGYPNLAELLLYSHLDIEIWKTAVRNLMRTHEILRTFPGDVSPKEALDIYWNKTEERVNSLTREDPFFNELLEQEEIRINGQPFVNYPGLKDKIKARCISISESVTGTIIHGDYCLSNILYDVNNQLVRLIDPRGSFGKRSIYGDPRYDMAKLRHSISGAYDYITSDLFSLKYLGNEFTVDICNNPLNPELSDFLDESISNNGYELDEIRFIEALLFLSMIPLHKDKPRRQIMMYLRAIELMNSIFYNTK